MKVNKELIHHILHHNVSEVIDREELEKKLLSGKKLRVKFGIDPTGAFLTLGHAIVLHKLKEFQNAGHDIYLLFGNFTAQIGDPTGKSETRKPLTREQVEKNANTYLEQVGKILDLKKIKTVWNADWFEKFNFQDVLQLAGQFTVAQMLERDMFQERIKKDQPIGLHEFLYPLMQGYDSVELKADLELGGNDQMFNMMAARPLQKAASQTPQAVMTMKILVGTDGVKKMGKSENNFIALHDAPRDMFGKIMSIPDHLMPTYFEMCSHLEDRELAEIQKRLAGSENPRNLKIELATAITSLYHGPQAADQAAMEFNRVFSQGGTPDELQTITLSEKNPPLLDLLIHHQLIPSKGEGKRLMDGGGLKVNQQKISDYNFTLSSHEEYLVQIGKRKFVKFIPHSLP